MGRFFAQRSLTIFFQLNICLQARCNHQKNHIWLVSNRLPTPALAGTGHPQKCPMFPTWGNSRHLRLSRWWYEFPPYFDMPMTQAHDLSGHTDVLGIGEPMATIKAYEHMTKGLLWLSRMEFSLTYVTFFFSDLAKSSPYITSISTEIYKMLKKCARSSSFRKKYVVREDW